MGYIVRKLPLSILIANTATRTWINNYVCAKEYDVITHLYTNFNGALVKSALNLKHDE